MELLWWLITIVLFAVGVIGTVLPVMPGTTIILAAAVIHRVMLGSAKSVGWKTIVLLSVLTLTSYAFDFLAGYVGAKYFGASRWASFGAIVGVLIGMWFGFAGLFVGPVVGAILGELIVGKRLADAGRAGWGSLLGNVGGVFAKLLIALVMVTIFLVSVPSPI